MLVTDEFRLRRVECGVQLINIFLMPGYAPVLLLLRFLGYALAPRGAGVATVLLVLHFPGIREVALARRRCPCPGRDLLSLPPQRK